MSKPGDDLDAVRAIVEVLQDFDAREQQRIFRWAAEKLGLPQPFEPASETGSKRARKGYVRNAEPDLEVEASELDRIYEDAVRVVVESGDASTSLLQRRLRMPYSRAALLLDLMERDGIVSAPEGSNPREVLKRPDWLQENK